MKNIFSIFKKKKSVSSQVTESFIQDDSILVGYANINEQIITYGSALTFFNPNLSILDIGCGRGDLFAFMKEQYDDVFLDSNYYGIDKNEILITAGIQKYNINNIHLQDFNSFKSDKKYNWISALNYFNEPVEDNYKVLYNTIDKMFNLCSTAIVFNVITKQADIHQDQVASYSLYDAGQIFNHLTNVYKKVIVRADYLLGDTMFYVFKN